MTDTLKGILSACLALLLVACDKEGRPLQEPGLDRLERGASTEGDIRAVMGMPDAVWQERDGGRVLQYPRGPEGSRTWEFTIDRTGILSDYRQLLTEENFVKVKLGMSREEVRRLLGRERSIAQFKRKNEEVLDWRYQAGISSRFFNVHFDMTSGKVTGTSSSEADDR